MTEEVANSSPQPPQAIRWFWKGVRDDSAEPQPVWFSREEGQGHVWKPLRKNDCDAINRAEVDEVTVENGRAIVDLKNLIMSFTFYRKPCRRVKSAIWFEYKGPGPKIRQNVPLSKVDESKIEALYQRAVTATQSDNSIEEVNKILKEKIILEDDMYEVAIVKSLTSNTLSMIKRLRNNLQAILSFESEKSLLRGYGPYYVEGETEEVKLGPVRHLFFVIHGIGEAYWSRDDVNINSMVEEMESVRSNIHKKQFEQWRKKCRNIVKTQGSMPKPPNRVEFIPIEWYDKIHSSSSTLKTTLLSSTLDTIPIFRSLANDVVFDVLMYMTPEFCQLVLQHVTNQINDLYRDFLNLHPGFEEYGKVSIIGHSLGSVIAWDLLCVLQDNTTSDLLSSQRLGWSLEPLDSKEQTWSTVERIMKQFKLPTVGRLDQAEYGNFETAAWGPRLPERMTCTINFTPTVTILLGSPLAMFLSLRGAYPALQKLETMLNSEYSPGLGDEKEELIDGDNKDYKLVSTNPFHLTSSTVINIFHPSDPVAYRIEPLLFPTEVDDDVFFPPPSSLTDIKGRKVLRPRVNACKASWRAFQAIKGVFVPPMKKDYMTSTSVTAAGKRLKRKPPSQFDFDITKKIDDINPLKEKTQPKKLKFKFALGGELERVDHQLTQGVAESEILASTSAHQSYFSNEEFLKFLMQFGEHLTTETSNS